MFLITKTISHQPHYFRSSQNHFLSCLNCFPSQKLVIQIAKIISLFLKELSQMKKSVITLEGIRILNTSQECPLCCHCASLWFLWQLLQRQHQVHARSITQIRTIAFSRSALILVIPSPEGFFRRGAQGEFLEAHQRGGRGRKGQGAQKKWARHLCRRWFH